MSLSIKKLDYIFRLLQTVLKQSLMAFIYFYAAYKILPKEYGEVIYLLSVAALLLLFCDFGISPSMMKYIAESDREEPVEKPKVLGKVLIILFCITLSVLLLFYFFIEVFSFKIVRINYNTFFLIPYIIFTPLNSALDGYLVGKKKFKPLFIVNFLAWLICIPLTYYLINTFYTSGVLIGISTSAVIYFLLYLVVWAKDAERGKVNSSVKPIFSYALILGFSSFAYFLYTRVDIFVLKSFAFVEEIGYYDIVNRVFALLVVPFAIFGQVKAPNVARHRERSDKEFVKDFKKTFVYVFIAGMVIAILLYLLLPILIQHFLPQFYTDRMKLIFIILLGVVPLKFCGVVSTIGFITPSGFARITMYVTFIFGLANIAMDYLFIYYFGFVGVFWATLLCHNLAIIVQLSIFMKKLRNV